GLPTAKWPRPDRCKEPTVELPMGELAVTPANERALREALALALEHGKGVVHVVPANGRTSKPNGRRNGHGVPGVEVYSTKRACPVCSRSFPPPDPRLFSFNSKHGWCPECYGTG